MDPFDSFGTASSTISRFSSWKLKLLDFLAVVKAMKQLAIESTEAHNAMLSFTNIDNREETYFPYFRFEGGEDLGKLDLGEWKKIKRHKFSCKGRQPGGKTLRDMEDAVREYLQRKDVEENLVECARILVQRRRLRERSASEWDRYAYTSYYVCDLMGCIKERIPTAKEFELHLQFAYGMRFGDKNVPLRKEACRHCVW